MNIFQKNNWLKILMGIFFIVIVGGIFYWYWIKFGLSVIANKPQEMIAEKLTNEEINKISKSVFWLSCSAPSQNGEGNSLLFGSGTYIHRSLIDDKKSKDDFNYLDGYILTNAHVAVLKENSNNCWVGEQGDSILPPLKSGANPYFGFFVYDKNTDFLDNNIDIALLKKMNTPKEEDILKLKSRLLENYPSCFREKIIGSSVYIFGYPATGEEDDETLKNKMSKIGIDDSLVPPKRNLIVSTGIISGIDGQENYYTDAKIDSGSSGGLAVSKIGGEICIVGIPTWASIGEFESLGMIQPFGKILSALGR